jgi:hypothetical protein
LNNFEALFKFIPLNQNDSAIVSACDSKAIKCVTTPFVVSAGVVKLLQKLFAACQV